MLANHPPDSSGEKPSKPQYSRPFVPPDNLPAHLLKRGVKRSDPDEERRYMQDETKLRKTLGMEREGRVNRGKGRGGG